MPPFEEMDRYQPAVYWAATGDSDAYGQRVVDLDNPVELAVRWIFKRSEAAGPDSTRVLLDATLVTDRALVVGSRVWPGELSEWYGTGSGTGDEAYEEDVYRVVYCNKTVDIKGGRATRYDCGLQRFRRDPGEGV